jgi:hypothetical protein
MKRPACQATSTPAHTAQRHDEPLEPRCSARGTPRLRDLLLVAVTALAAACGGSAPDGDGTAATGHGATTFSRSFGGGGHDEARAVAHTSDGGYVFVGAIGGDRKGNGTDLWINKLDANGNVEWERAIGERSPGGIDRVREFEVVRRTADGGFIVAGRATDPPRDDQNPTQPPPGATGDDLWIAKLFPTGETEWSRDYDSGAWPNFPFAAPNYGRGAFADEVAGDIQPLADGGYLVATHVRANLVVGPARDDGGFDPPASPVSGQVFVNADSVWVTRLDAAGSIVWQRRLTEGQFAGGLTPLHMRPAADGGAVLAYHGYFDGERRVRVVRFNSGGDTLWQADESVSADITDIAQTDDSGDGVRDDGFIVVATDNHHGLEGRRRSRVVKFDRDGRRQWRVVRGIDDETDTVLQSVGQVCAPGGAGLECEFVLAGHYRGRDATTFANNGYLLRLSQGGDTRAERIVADASVVRGVAALGNNRVAALQETAPTAGAYRSLQRVLLQWPGLEPVDVSGPVTPTFADRLAADGSVLQVGTIGQRFYSYAAPVGSSAALVLERSVDLSHDRDTENAVGVVEVAPGSYIVAGNADARYGSSFRQAWVLRVTNGRVDWQRRFDVGLGTVHALTASGDGGAVFWLGESLFDARLVKLAPTGEVAWVSPDVSLFPQVTVHELRAMPDGGYVAVGESDRESTAVVVRLDADGNALWQRSYAGLRATSIDTVDADGDGVRDDGFVLAGQLPNGTSGLARVVRLDAAGEVVWARAWHLPLAQPADPYVHRIRQARDGGFVIGTTEVGAIAPNALGHAHGQANVLLMKLNASGDLAWSRSYGAFLNERLHDLQVLPDGGLIVAGASDSLGDRSEAWVLRLGSDGLLAAGCNAFLGALPVTAFRVESIAAIGRNERLAVAAMRQMLVPIATTLMPRVPQTVVARQCAGNANPSEPPSAPPTVPPGVPPSEPPSTPPPAARYTLTLQQPGGRTGVVVSTPAGLLCGTAASAPPCSASFAAGSDVFLAVEIGSVANFVRWEGCDEQLPPDSGGAVRCRVRLDRDRAVSAVFDAPATPPPPPAGSFTLTVMIDRLGGFVGTTDGRLGCQVSGGQPRTCAVQYVAGSIVDLYAASLPGGNVRLETWQGDCASFGAQMNVRLVMDRDYTCRAVFVSG